LGGRRGRLTSSSDRFAAVRLISEAISNGARKIAACKIFNISIRTVQRWSGANFTDKRKGASKTVGSKLTEEEKAQIIKICCSPRFMNETPNKIVPILAEEGIYIASESSFYRVLREANLLKHRHNSRHKRKSEKVEITSTGPNQTWSWDITYLKSSTKGKFYYLYLFMDVWSRMITGWDIHETECGKTAADLMETICTNHGISKGSLILHSDNGSPMKSANMLAALQKLGVAPSNSRPRVSDDNAFSESLFKTLKYTVGYPKYFKELSQANEWVERFVEWYNNEHRHSMIGYVTPEQRHTGKDKEILDKRKRTYQEAKKKNPERWKNRIRNWDKKEVVSLKKGNYKKVS